MKLTIQCPEDSSAVPALASSHPLVLAPFLDQTVLAHALSALADQGVKQIRIEAMDGSEAIRRAVGGGEAWGLKIEVVVPGRSPDADSLPLLLQHLPQLPSQPLWTSYRDWYNAQMAMIPSVAARRIGMREIAPGMFAGLRSRISPEARLEGPCWIGANVCIEAEAVIGAGAIIGDTCFIDRGAEVRRSVIGSETYVGAYTEVADSFASQSRLLHLDSGSVTEITDGFLLGAVQPHALPPSATGVRGLLARLWRRHPADPRSTTPTEWGAFGRLLRFGQ